MTGLGIFEDGISSMFFAAKIIHESIRQLREENLLSTSEVTTKKVRRERGYLANTVKFIIPMEIEVEGKYVLIPDSEDVAFSVERAKKGCILNFIQRGFPIGQANVIESITSLQLSKLLNEAMQLPIESEGANNFAARIIQATINKIMKDEAEAIPTRPILPTHPKEEAEDTSDELKHYLSLLDQN